MRGEAPEDKRHQEAIRESLSAENEERLVEEYRNRRSFHVTLEGAGKVRGWTRADATGGRRESNWAEGLLGEMQTISLRYRERKERIVPSGSGL